VTASQVAWPRRWVGGLPALLLLLLASVGGVGRAAQGPAVGGAETALGAAPAATQPAAAPRADPPLLAKRGGQWAAGPMAASGSVPALRVAPPAAWLAVTGAATAARHRVRGEVFQGRAPPSAA
jgi:hypothetical protein